MAGTSVWGLLGGRWRRARRLGGIVLMGGSSVGTAGVRSCGSLALGDLLGRGGRLRGRLRAGLRCVAGGEEAVGAALL